MNIPIIGQEAVCPDGLGRVTQYAFVGKELDLITVELYIGGLSCGSGHTWKADSVKLVPIFAQEHPVTNLMEANNVKLMDRKRKIDRLTEKIYRCVTRIKEDADAKQYFNDAYVPRYRRASKNFYVCEADRFITQIMLETM